MDGSTNYQILLVPTNGHCRVGSTGEVVGGQLSMAWGSISLVAHPFLLSDLRNWLPQQVAYLES